MAPNGEREGAFEKFRLWKLNDLPKVIKSVQPGYLRDIRLLKTQYGPTLANLSDDDMASADELHKTIRNPLSPHTSPKRVVKVKPLVEDILSSENELDYLDCDHDSEVKSSAASKSAKVDSSSGSSSSSSSVSDSETSSGSTSSDSSSDSSSCRSRSPVRRRRLSKRLKVRSSSSDSDDEERRSGSEGQKVEKGKESERDGGVVETEISGVVSVQPSEPVVAVGELESQEASKDSVKENIQVISDSAKETGVNVVLPLVSILQQTQNERVILNIGGQRFETSKLTLSRYPESVLAELVSSEGVTPRYGNVYFVDRDPAHFRLVLNFMRNGMCDLRTLPRDVRYLYELYYEASYYRLSDLMRAVIEKIEQVSVFPADLPFTAHKVGL